MDEKKENFNSISYKELIYFKEEIFRSLKDFEKKFLEKTNESLKQYDTKIDETKNLINKYKNETSIFLKKEDFENEKKEIINKATNKKSFDEKFTALDIRISALNKEIGEACFKYDKIFINQLTLPGIIGEHCKYKSIGDYIKNNINEMTNISNDNKKVLNNMNISKGKFEDRINEFNYIIENNKKQLNNSINLKIAELQVKLEDRIVIIEDNIKSILSGENIEKRKKNIIEKKINSISDFSQINDLNQIKQELFKKMNEIFEKSKKMDLSVLREIEIVKSKFNNIKKSLYDLAKYLLKEIEINDENFQSDKNEKLTYLLQKIKNLFEENVRKKNLEKTAFPKRKAVSSIKEQKFFFEHRIKTGVIFGNRKSSINLNQNDSLIGRDFKDDDFILGKGSHIDLKLNLLQHDEKISNSFVGNVKKKTIKNSGILELRAPSMKTINEIKPENEYENEYENEKDKESEINDKDKDNSLIKPVLKQEEKKSNS